MRPSSPSHPPTGGGATRTAGTGPDAPVTAYISPYLHLRSSPSYTSEDEAADGAAAVATVASDHESDPSEGAASLADDGSLFSDPGPVEDFVRSTFLDLHLAVRHLQESNARAQPAFVTADGGVNVDALNDLRDTLGTVTQALTEVATWMWAREAPTEQCPSGRDVPALANPDWNGP